MFRKISIILLFALCFTANALSQETKAIAGVWAGRLPCADCEYISYRLTLNNDGSFTEEMDYYNLDRRPAVSTGKWSYSAPFLTLNHESGAIQRFETEGSVMYMLDSDGKRVPKVQLEKQSFEKGDSQK
jgi:uncharacterized lipoprotein NlpE involved in copper resistance